LADGLEINQYRMLPLVAGTSGFADLDGDGARDGDEVAAGTDPPDPEKWPARVK